MKTLAIDIETRSSTDLGKLGVYKYAEDPDFDILLFAYSVDSGPVHVCDLLSGEKIPPHIMTALTNPNVLKTAYNANFERTCLALWLGIPMPPAQWECTMVRAVEAGLPRSLKLAALALGLPDEQQKDARGKQLIRLFCNPARPSLLNGGTKWNGPEHYEAEWAEFKEYCRQDVVTEQAVRQNTPDINPGEQELWIIDQEINDRGVLIDRRLAENACAISDAWRQDLTERARQITGLANPNSRDQLLTWINSVSSREYDSLRKGDLSVIAEETDSEDVKEILHIRSQLAKSSIKKYDAMLANTNADGRARGLTMFYGAEATGRWAGRRIQLQNLYRNTLPDAELDAARNAVLDGNGDSIAKAYDDPAGILGQLVRTALIPKSGCRFIVSDFSAIEARVLAWLAGETWRLETFRTGGKLYEASAASMFHVPVENIVHGRPEYALRQKGKICELALGYQGGPGALIAMGALKMGLSESELPELVQQWRSASPHIVSYWKTLEDAAISCAASKRGTVVRRDGCPDIRFEMDSFGLHMILPSGRDLTYRGAHLIPHSKWEGKWELRYETNDPAKPIATTYGGRIAENATQAVARDCLAESMKTLDTLGYNIVFHVHDEVIIEHPTGTGSAQEIADIMSTPIAWAPGLPLNAEAYECEYYRKD